MIDSDQRPDSNRHPLLKSASTDVIISNQHPLTSLSQIGIHWRHYLKSASTDVIISNQHPLMSLSQISIHWHHYLKSASTDVIISNRHPLTSLSQIGIHWRHYLKSASTDVIISNLRPFQILRSMANLLVRVRVSAYVSDVIGRWFEKLRNGHRFENLKEDIDLSNRCLWRRNRTWIWGLDVN